MEDKVQFNGPHPTDGDGAEQQQSASFDPNQVPPSMEGDASAHPPPQVPYQAPPPMEGDASAYPPPQVPYQAPPPMQGDASAHPPPYQAPPPMQGADASAYPPPQVPYQSYEGQPLPMKAECDALLQQPELHGPGPYGTGPQWPGPQPHAAPPSSTVVMQPLQATVGAVIPAHFTTFPTVIRCFSCGNTVTTDTHKQIGSAVWLSSALTCGFGLFFGLCCVGLIPFCIPALHDTVHTCPVCKCVLGKHSHL